MDATLVETTKPRGFDLKGASQGIRIYKKVGDVQAVGSE
jgi:hypothetical protein